MDTLYYTTDTLYRTCRVESVHKILRSSLESVGAPCIRLDVTYLIMLGMRQPRRPAGSCQSGSQYVHHLCEKRPGWYPHNSISIGLQTENSTAIDRGAAPDLKSDDFFVCNPMVIEQSSISSVQPPESVVHILGARLGVYLCHSHIAFRA